ncbi:hypothetical protein LZ31DRAFT_155701 [Colletotrichum somersetense]|nr:hypothetical protein LZ31DRAFT_155701 [Colletotrichum somersetense]
MDLTARSCSLYTVSVGIMGFYLILIQTFPRTCTPLESLHWYNGLAISFSGKRCYQL